VNPSQPARTPAPGAGDPTSLPPGDPAPAGPDHLGSEAAADRPARPTIAELRTVCQPDSVRGRAVSEHWIGDLWGRRLSPYLVRLLLPTGITANGVTWLMILSGAGAAVATTWVGLPGAVLAAVLVQLQMYLDCADGEIARWRRTSSAVGVYLDRIGHYVAECGIALGLGIRVAGEFTLDSAAVTMGALLALLVALNKVENDLVHVSRAQTGRTALPDSEGVRTPRAGLLRAARRAARLLPFHRVFHSVEMSLLVLVLAVADAVLGGDDVTRIALPVLLVTAAVTVAGHLVAVLSSSRLR
jgi:phosphatidylglycerophosphate synthase